jgi:hypothetical protein
MLRLKISEPQFFPSQERASQAQENKGTKLLSHYSHGTMLEEISLEPRREDGIASAFGRQTI